MRVLVATTAGTGHLGPLLPFAGALRSAGHDVVVAAPASFAPAVERAGFTHRAFPDASPDEQGAVFASLRGLTHEEANQVVMSEIFCRINSSAALPGLQSLVEQWQPDLVLREACEFASYVAAEAAGIPHAEVAVSLDLFTELVQPRLEGPLADLGSRGGTAGLRAAPRMSLLPPSFEAGPANAVRRFHEPAVATGIDPLPDWWSGSSAPLVYVTFGTVAANFGLFPDFYQGVIDALAGLPVRVLLTLGDGDPELLRPLPANVHVERWWPQRQVMPLASAMVAHGGFGTTLSGMAAGLPMVIVPLFADQPENARRIAAVGAGIALEGGSGALAGLGSALERVLGEESFRAGVRRLADEIASLPPVSESVPWMEEIAAGRGAQT